MFKTLSGVLVALVTGAVLGSNYSSYQYEAQLAQAEAQASALLLENTKRQADYMLMVQQLSYEVQEAKQKYEASLMDASSEYDDWMRKSQERASHYQQQAQSCSTRVSALVQRTSALDRQLAQGVLVVRELRSLVELRDRELAAAKEQMIKDRELINGRE